MPPAGTRLPVVGVHVAGTAMHTALVGASLVAWWSGGFWLTCLPALWIAIVWMNHAALARLHEAIHCSLFPSGWLNELTGLAIGTAAWIPMTVYRHVHLQHHAWLGTPKDPELIPYSVPGASRGYRVFLAWAELLFGSFVTPALYTWRTLRAAPRFSRLRQIRFALELVVLVAFWVGVAAAVIAYGWFPEFAVAWLIPAWLTGVLQTVRKFIEHLGLGGTSIMSRCRTVAYRGDFARLLSTTQLHVEHHGTHHRYPSIAWTDLPKETDRLWAEKIPGPLYANHWAALREAFRSIGDPRVGSAITGETRAVG